MRKSIIFLLLFILSMSMVSGYEYNLLNKNEKVTAEALPITSAEIIPVAQAEALPFVYYLAGFLLLVYITSFWFRKHKMVKHMGKTLSHYTKYSPHIARVVLTIGFFWLALQTIGALKIVFYILGACLLLGAFQRVVSLVAIFIILNEMIKGNQSFELLGLLILTAVAVKNSPSIDQLLNIKTKRRKKWEKWVPLLLRISVGASLIINALTTIKSPKYFLVFLNKITFLANLPPSPESTIARIAMIQLLLGVMILFGFLQRVHSGVILACALGIALMLPSQGLSMLPLAGASLILIFMDPHKWSLDYEIKRI